MVACLAMLACSPGRETGNWNPEIKVQSSPAGSPSAEPHLFTDSSGIVFLSWVEKRGDSAWLKYSTVEGDRWSTPRVIAQGNTWFVNWADYPMVTSNGKGSLMAHVLGKSGKGTYAYDVKMYTSVDDGSNWSVPFILHDDGKQAEHGFVTMIPYGDQVFVTWLDGRNTAMEGMEGMDHDGHHGSMSLRAAVIGYDGVKTEEWELDDKTCDCCQTTAAITDSGPVVIYRDRTDEEIRDMSIVRLVDGSWTKPMPIHNDNWKIGGCPVNGPRVASAGNQLVVAWFSAANDTSQVLVAFSGDGGATFGKPIRVDEGNAIGRVDVVLLEKGEAVVSWMEGVMIKAARVYADGRESPSITIASSSESRSSGFPQMTRAGDTLIVAWTDDQAKQIKIARVSL